MSRLSTLCRYLRLQCRPSPLFASEFRAGNPVVSVGVLTIDARSQAHKRRQTFHRACFITAYAKSLRTTFTSSFKAARALFPLFSTLSRISSHNKEDTMVDEIRNKWCEDLEELLQCPYCMIVPQSDIRQCIEGHHVCKGCHSRLLVCPTCTSRWSSARNRLAEDLCSKLDDMKISLIDPDSELNKLLIPDRVSTACQTDAQKMNESPQGSFPCRIGSCSMVRPFEPLMNHLRTDHPDHFLQLPQEGNVFEHTWSFEVAYNMTFDWAVQITDMGTFFLKLSTDLFGILTAFVLMVQNAAVSKKYSYRLQVSCCAQHRSPIFNGTVRTCRTLLGAFPEKCLQVKRSELQKMKDHKIQLECNLILSKRSQTGKANLPQQGQKEIRPKKNNNAAKPPTTNGQNGSSTPGPSNGCVPANVTYVRPVSVSNENSMINRRSVYSFIWT